MGRSHGRRYPAYRAVVALLGLTLMSSCLAGSGLLCQMVSRAETAASVGTLSVKWTRCFVPSWVGVA